MQSILAQTGSGTSSSWWPLVKVGMMLVVFVVFPLLRQLKVKAEEKAKERRLNNLQREAELEAIRTGRGLEQVMMQPTTAGQSFPAPMEVISENDDPKARRERQLAELRRRAAARSQTTSVSSTSAGSGAQAVRLGSSNSPVPMLTRTPQTAARQIQTQAIPGVIQLPGGGAVQVGRQSPPPRPIAKPVPKAGPKQPQRMTAEQARQQAQRQAAQRQAVPTRKPNANVSDIPDGSETHRLVADSDVAKVTARQGRRGPMMGRAGIRQAMIMSEILGRPRSERLEEI